MINDLSAETIYNALNEVMDPEIPVVSLVEMASSAMLLLGQRCDRDDDTDLLPAVRR